MTMKFAVNASASLYRLLEMDAIDLDLIKCPEWDGIVNSAKQLRPVYIHFEISIGNSSLNGLDISLIKRMLDTTDTPHLNVHLSGNPQLQPNNRKDQRKLLDRWKADVDTIRRKIPGVPIIGENLPYLPTYPELRIANHSWMIRDLIENMEMGLLLDLSHIRITAAYENQDYQVLTEALPVQHLRELHLTGIKSYAGHLTDHFELNKQDFAAADWAIEKIKTGLWREPEIVSLEYGGFGDVFAWRSEERHLREQVPALWEKIHN